MECQNCELKQRQFCCENCLRQQLHSFRHQISQIAADRDAHIASAQRSLITVVNPQRTRRADLKGGEERVREIWDGLAALRKANEKHRERIRTLRDELATRRRTLAAAHALLTHDAARASPPPQTLPGSFPGGPFSSTPPHAARAPGHRKHASTPPSHTPSPSRAPSSARAAQGRAPALHARTPSTPSSHSPTPFQKHSPAQPNSTTVVGDRELARQIEDAAAQLHALADTTARARAGLVQELVEVFSVVEVGGRPPIGVKAGTKGEWTIGGLVLPVPGDMRRYPPDHINAVLTHTLHFLTLLAFYLGIKLPFEVVWSRASTPPTDAHAPAPPNLRGNGLLGVGTPWISAIKGGEHGGWAKWSTKHPLHVSMSAPTSGSASPSTSSPPHTLHPLHPSPSLSQPPALEDSHLDDGASTRAAGSSFTTALAMLLYDVCWLAHTQGVPVPLAGAGDALGNLWAVCGARELGRASHASSHASSQGFAQASAQASARDSAGASARDSARDSARERLPPPTHGFPMEFAQVLMATAANPTRARARVVGGAGAGGARRREVVEEAIEEEEWDIVDDVSG